MLGRQLGFMVVMAFCAACGRSALTNPNAPSAAPASTPEVASPDAGSVMTMPTNCRVIGAYAPIDSFAEHVSLDFEYTSASAWTKPIGVPGDTMWGSVTWARAGVDTGVTVPGTFDLSQGTYSTCVACVIFCELTAADRCSRRYLARSGQMTVSEASRATTGKFTASLRDVVFSEWDLISDLPIAHGRCITVQSAELSGRF